MGSESVIRKAMLSRVPFSEDAVFFGAPYYTRSYPQTLLACIGMVSKRTLALILISRVISQFSDAEGDLGYLASTKRVGQTPRGGHNTYNDESGLQVTGATEVIE